jgi:YbgC/YbaW family acyl-CoA thioester hydrolase
MTSKLFTVDEYVRWSDVDHAGIIFYGAYVRFFEIAETEMFRSAGLSYGEVFDRFDLWLPRVHLECDFLYPARLDDELRVSAYVAHFGNSSLRLNFDVLHLEANQLAATGHEVLCATDRETMKPKVVPEDLRSFLEPFVCSEEKARARLLR